MPPNSSSAQQDEIEAAEKRKGEQKEEEVGYVGWQRRSTSSAAKRIVFNVKERKGNS
jgi:hypothetical protein